MHIKIGKKQIGKNNKVFIIAEGGINHNGSLKIAKRIIQNAFSCDVDAIKFQTFKANDLASKNSKYFKIFKKLELEASEFAELSDVAKSLGLVFLSTPFSKEAVDLLNKIKIPAFKIASGDLTNIPLIQYAASKKKPMIISTGMANLLEIKETINSIKRKNNKIILMHSLSSYPSPVDETNLRAIHTLKKAFSYPVGYSDNGSSLVIPIIASSIGAQIIEKHFTIDKKMKGPDHMLSADPKDMKKLVKNIRLVEKSLGTGIKECQKSELVNKIQARRSIVAIKNLGKNEIIDRSYLDIKRPATGIEPKFLEKIVGKKIKKSVKSDQSITWKDIY